MNVMLYKHNEQVKRMFQKYFR